MKNFRFILFLTIAIILGIVACKKDTIQLESKEDKILEQTKLQNNPSHSFLEKNDASKNLDNFTATIHDLLYEINEEEDFMTKVSEHHGIPNWENSINLSDEALWVPLMKNKDVSGLFSFYIIDDQLHFSLHLTSLLEKLQKIESGEIQVPLQAIEIFKNNLSLGEKSACETPCNIFGSQCYCLGFVLCPTSCSGNGDGDGGYGEDTIIIGEWTIVLGQFPGGGTKPGKPNQSGGGSSTDNKGELIQDLTDEQVVLNAVLDYLGGIGEDGTNMDIQILLGSNPQIMNPIYIYINNGYDGVTPNPAIISNLLDLLLDNPLLDLVQAEVEQLLISEPGLTNVIQNFLDNHPNDALAIEVVHDFLALQDCVSGFCDQPNNLDAIYDFYNTLTSDQLDCLNDDDAILGHPELGTTTNEIILDMILNNNLSNELGGGILGNCCESDVFTECANETLLELTFNVDIVEYEIIDGVLFGVDNNGILHVYVEPIDFSQSTHEEILFQIITVLTEVQKWFCETNEYEPIDLNDYFYNINVNDLDGFDVVYDFPDGEFCVFNFDIQFTSGSGIMETSPNYPSDNGTHFTYTWSQFNESSFDIPVLSISSPYHCIDKFYDHINIDCD